ncbi:hypothetical protein PFICI_02602 [Pestalotiopsis fici W106-1]|uniref:Uncharacterized protein n=1 Tax=Pestalotiopsis fici (strain W106-1 / CGMCC3.15140) TaxID=1229662 RepID=W3XGL1_PESFW|nr:uncharacterized protein PFICI_02602 [Pestalotiopsis fici W106-1]ETS84577.1 hypothetical protein PFICI_02602 [Pestalotiopsis fici W106-1]
MSNIMQYRRLPGPSSGDAEMQTVADLLPVEANKITRFDEAQIQKDAADTRIIVHHRYPDLVKNFLDHKREHGSDIERHLYKDDASWTWQQQVRRLVEKRPLMFMGGRDMTILRDGTSVGSLFREWDRVGTDAEVSSRWLKLKDYLSYDEIMLGSLLGVSGPSYFINDGNRYNNGQPMREGTFIPRGIVVGLVGARYERDDRMDSVFCKPAVRSPKQHPDLTRVFTDFFGKRPNPSRPFNLSMYKARMKITIELLLCEANDRAKAAGKKAYVHVVGLGLGVWSPPGVKKVPEAYIEGFMDVIEDDENDDDKYANIGTIDFSYITVPQSVRNDMQAVAAKADMDAIFSMRSPGALLPAHKQNELLIVSYAWDGNSFPGNEYWGGSLSASGDPAQACMSTIAELHNPILNAGFLDNIKTLP